MISKHLVWGRLNTFIGFSSRWGIELTYEVKEPALTFHIFNVFIAFEWWPREWRD